MPETTLAKGALECTVHFDVLNRQRSRDKERKPRGSAAPSSFRKVVEPH